MGFIAPFIAPLVTALGGASGIGAIGSLLGGAASLGSMFKGAPKAPPPVAAPAMVNAPPATAAPTMASAPVAAAGATQKKAAAAMATQSGTVGAGGPQGLQETNTKEKATLLG